jgi:hypothetical protein
MEDTVALVGLAFAPSGEVGAIRAAIESEEASPADAINAVEERIREVAPSAHLIDVEPDVVRPA